MVSRQKSPGNIAKTGGVSREKGKINLREGLRDVIDAAAA